MEYLSNIGFLGTSASYFIDYIIVYLLLLPILITFSISLASSRNYGLHRFMQTLLFLLTLIIVVTFNYNIYIVENLVSPMQIFSIFIIQMVLSIFTLIFWLSTLLFAIEDRRRKALPGFYSRSHRRSGKRLFFIIILDILSILYLYWRVYAT